MLYVGVEPSAKGIENARHGQTYSVCCQQAWCRIVRPMVKNNKILTLTVVLEPGIDLHYFPEASIAIACD